MLFVPKQRVHSGRIPDHCDWLQKHKGKLSLCTVSIAGLLESQVCLCADCPHNEVKTELHFLTSCQMYDHIRDTYFPQTTQTHKEFENKINFWSTPISIGYNTTVSNHSSKICDLLPQEKSNQWRINIVKINYIYCLFISPSILQLFAPSPYIANNITLEMSILLKNICECNVYR